MQSPQYPVQFFVWPIFMTRNFLVLIIASLLVPTFCQADWGLPNPPSTAIGDIGTLYLADPGIVWDVHNNDWIGQTDKLTTFSSALSYFKALQTKEEKQPTPESFKLALNSRLLTPIITTRFGSPNLNPPEGVLAEWLELQLAYSRFLGRFKLELSYDIDFFGNFHSDDLYRYAHQIVASPDEWSLFGNRFEGTYGAGSVGIGYLWNDYLLSMVYYGKSVVMEEQTLATSLVIPLSDTLSIAGENRFVIQTSSRLYPDERPYRHEWGWGFRWHFWQVSFKYVSPYLERDRWGQYYISPLVINWRF